MLHDQLFEPYQVFEPHEGSFEPVAASTAVNWDLISKIDPNMLGIPSVYQSFNVFLSEIPFYRFSSADAKVLNNALAVRLVLLMQQAIVLMNHKLQKASQRNEWQLTQIHGLAEKVKATENDRAVKDIKMCEKCYVCGKRFRSLRQLNGHIEKNHPQLVTSWNRIISNDFLDENVEMIAKLKAEIYRLRVQLHDQDATRLDEEERRKRMRELAAKYRRPTGQVRTSAMGIQPKSAPIPQIQTADMRFEPMFPDVRRYTDSEEEDDAEELAMIVHDARGHVREQAKVATGKKEKRRFRNVRESLRIQLEHQIPIPEELPPQKRPTRKRPSSRTSSAHPQEQSEWESYPGDSSMTSVCGPLPSPKRQMPRPVTSVTSDEDESSVRGTSSGPAPRSVASVEAVSSGSESESVGDQFLVTDSSYISNL